MRLIDAIVGALRRLSAHPQRAAWLVFAIALLPRVLLALWMPEDVSWADGHRYVKVADNLLAGEGFGSIWDNYMSVPTLPLLLALLTLVFGKQYLLFRLFFAALAAVSCVMGAALGRRLFGPAVGLLAGLGLALYPSLVYLGVLYEYPQPLFIVLMTGFFLVLHAWRERGGLWRPAAAGLLLGASVLTVPTILAYIPLLLLCAPWLRLPGGARAWAIVLVATAIPVLSWSFRNQAAYGEFILVNKSASMSFWQGNNDNYVRYGKAGVLPACGYGFEFTRFCQDFSNTAAEGLDPALTPLQAVNLYSKRGWQYGLQFILEDPWRSVLLTLRKFALFWSPLPDAVQLSDDNVPKARTVAATVSYVPVLLLALLAAWQLRRRWRELLPVVAYVVALSAPYLIMLPELRYRLPIDFMFVILAACAFVGLAKRQDPAV